VPAFAVHGFPDRTARRWTVDGLRRGHSAGRLHHRPAGPVGHALHVCTGIARDWMEFSLRRRYLDADADLFHVRTFQSTGSKRVQRLRYFRDRIAAGRTGNVPVWVEHADLTALALAVPDIDRLVHRAARLQGAPPFTGRQVSRNAECAASLFITATCTASRYRSNRIGKQLPLVLRWRQRRFRRTIDVTSRSSAADIPG